MQESTQFQSHCYSQAFTNTLKLRSSKKQTKTKRQLGLNVFFFFFFFFTLGKVYMIKKRWPKITNTIQSRKPQEAVYVSAHQLLQAVNINFPFPPCYKLLLFALIYMKYFTRSFNQLLEKKITSRYTDQLCFSSCFDYLLV